MKHYVITTTILNRNEGATPQDVTYYRGTDPFAMLRNLLSAATREGDEAASTLPLSMQYDVTSVRLDMFDVPDPDPETDASSSIMRAAYSLLGDGQGKEWTDNPEYTRAVVEMVRDTCGLGDADHDEVLGMILGLGHDGDHILPT